MQDSDKSTVKLKANVKAIEAIAEQVKAIAEEFQVTESVAFRIIEDNLALAAAVYDWDLSASWEAQGTGCKCGEGACKAKEKAQAPAPVRKPAATEAAPEATDMIWVDSQNRVTIPIHIIELAEDINGTLKRGGALTVIKGEGKVTVLFGDKSAEHKGASVVRLNCKGQAQICVSPAFTHYDTVKCSLFRDGAIAITQLSEDELLDLI